MYEKGKVVTMSASSGLLTKNLQVVSFDSEWNEIYLGSVRRDHFTAFCPNPVDSAVAIDFKWKPSCGGDVEVDCQQPVTITVAKWCPMENCTVLVLGSQYGIRLYDWDGSTLIYNYDFNENGIGVDDKQVTGGMAKGIAALGPNYISVGIHTGTIVLFNVTSDTKSFMCSVVDSQRCHVHPITDLASTTTNAEDCKEVLASGDDTGKINIWCLKGSTLKLLKSIEPFGDFPVTTLSLWNRVGKGIIVAGYGSGHLRIFAIPSGSIVAEVTAHAGWITGMDLASQSGLLITSSEDGFVRVWQLSQKGRIISHRYSQTVKDSLLNGVKFLDPTGASFAVTSYDSNQIQFYVM